MPLDNDNQNDALQNAIDSNPCGLCRAMGSASCRGHGGSGGGSSSGKEGSSDKPANQQPEAAKSLARVVNSINPGMVVVHLVQECEGWSEDKDNVDWVISFDNPYAFFKMQLNIDNATITANEKEGLTQTEQQDVQLLFKEILDEYKEFKDVENIDDAEEIPLIDRELKIKIPKPRYYDLFLDKLFQKNLLPNQSLRQQLQKDQTMALTQENQEEDEEYGYSSTAPTPFSMQPKPKGTDRSSR